MHDQCSIESFIRAVYATNDLTIHVNSFINTFLYIAIYIVQLNVHVFSSLIIFLLTLPLICMRYAHAFIYTFIYIYIYACACAHCSFSLKLHVRTYARTHGINNVTYKHKDFMPCTRVINRHACMHDFCLLLRSPSRSSSSSPLPSSSDPAFSSWFHVLTTPTRLNCVVLNRMIIPY